MLATRCDVISLLARPLADLGSLRYECLLSTAMLSGWSVHLSQRHTSHTLWCDFPNCWGTIRSHMHLEGAGRSVWTGWIVGKRSEAFRLAISGALKLNRNALARGGHLVHQDLP